MQYLLFMFFLFLTTILGVPFTTNTSIVNTPMPTASALPSLNVKDPRGLYVCRGKNWQEPCHWDTLEHSLNICTQFLCDADRTECLKTGMPGVWMSFGPDKGVKCTLYSSINCKSGMRESEIMYPGTGDLLTFSYDKERGANGVPITYAAWKCVYV